MSTSTNIQTNKYQLGLDAESRTYISRQALLFEAMLPELLHEYLGKWVLFEDNRVLDADEDYQSLLTRIQKTVGNKIVLIKKVESAISPS